MNKNSVKKALKNILSWYFLNQTGMRRLNGGYADITELKFKLKGDTYLCSGTMCYGVQDGEENSMRVAKFNNEPVSIKLLKERMVDEL